jgi:hypothetical protein
VLVVPANWGLDMDTETARLVVEAAEVAGLSQPVAEVALHLLAAEVAPPLVVPLAVAEAAEALGQTIRGAFRKRRDPRSAPLFFAV